ncbi:protein kinase domain-containing protein [Streptomyces sp. DSM 118148]|uniref:protein kinase domain-containing protein n=1 Tax=Streptomyces sp. DSM 118148 TaxID=3448667 RepID=UPI0040402079
MDKLGPGDPRQIGAYRLLARLGAGGMGQVFLARSDRGRTVAVKLVREELAAREEFRARFRQEVGAARRVGGYWTAPVLDADTEAPVPWVATGYVAGPSLQQVVGHDHGALPERSVRILAAGLAHALQDIHAAGIVHRDLKPSNVLVTIDGPRVIDFGIARALETLAGGGLTRTGSLVGSPGFMAPEQVRGDRVTPACDVFCLGSVLAYAATGVMPFGGAGSGAHALMFRIAQEEPDLERVPEGIADLVRDCLRKDPAARPPLTRVLEWTGAEDTVADGRSRDPWLPGALVAQLGRHAVRLLETEDPQGGADTGASRGSGTAGGSALPAPGAGAAVPGAPAGRAAPGAGAARVPVEGGGVSSGPGGATGGGVPAGSGAGGAGGPVGPPAPVRPVAPAGSGASGAGGTLVGSGASGAGGSDGARVPVEGAGVSSGTGGPEEVTVPAGSAATEGADAPVGPVDQTGPADLAGPVVPAGAPGASGPGGAQTPGAAGPGGEGASGPLDKGSAPPAGAGAGSSPASPTAGAGPAGAGAVAFPADQGAGAHPAGPGAGAFAGAGGALGGAGASGGQAAGSGASPEHGLVADGAPRPADRSDGGGAAAGHLPSAPAGQAPPAGASQAPPGYGAPDPYGSPAPYGYGYPQQAQQHPQPASAGYGYPQPPSAGYGYPQPPSAGYGYPQQPYPPYGGLGATPPHGPPPFAGQPEPARPGGRSTALLVVIALVVALGAGGSVYALMRPGGDTAGPAPAGATSAPGTSRAPTPTDSASPSVTASPTAVDGAVPAAYLGTWTTTIDNTGGANTRRLTIAQGDVGDTVLTLVADGPVEGGGTYHCVFEAALAEQPHGDGPLEIGPSTVTSGDPMSSCSPGEATEVTLLPDGRLKRAKAGGGESLTYTRQ